MKIIAFCGPAGVGKSTAAQYYLTRGYTKISFADPLRRMLAALTDVENGYNERKNEPRWELCGKTIRQALQTLGTEWGRGLIGEDLWLRQFQQTVEDHPHKHWVVDDCRFDNEASLIRKLGGVVVRVERPGFEFVGGHASEAGISPELIDACVSGNNPEDLWESLRYLPWVLK